MVSSNQNDLYCFIAIVDKCDCVFNLFLSLHQQRQQETHEEYRGGAQDDGEIGMQVDARKMP
jgi:hypothetical protein